MTAAFDEAGSAHDEPPPNDHNTASASLDAAPLVYAAIPERIEPAAHDSEREKWDRYYRGQQLPVESAASAEFSSDLAGMIADFLPAGSRVLEAGCGEGFQSLALARQDRYDLALMDFSSEALRLAKLLFAREGRTAQFMQGDVLAPGEPEYDLVANAGVLEHYRAEDQVKFLRGMASRSRNYVLVLVPNRYCYWYWIWRLRVIRDGNWPYGRECPLADLSAIFEAAGLKLCGQRYTAASWTETFINQLEGLTDEDRETILAAHRSPFLPDSAKGYLLAAVGSVRSDAPVLPAPWSQQRQPSDITLAEACAALADVTGQRLSLEQQLRDARTASSGQSRRDKLMMLGARLDELHAWVEKLNEQLTRKSSEALGLWERYQDLDARYAAAMADMEQTRAHCTELARGVETSRARAAELEARIAADQQRVAEFDAQMARTQALCDEQHRLFEEKSAEADRIWRAYTAEKKNADTRATQIELQSADLQRLSASNQYLDRRLSDILNSTGWRVLQVMYKIRFFLFPRGSLRERGAKWLMQQRRKLRSRALAREAQRDNAAVAGSAADTGTAETIRTGTPGLVSVILPVYNQANLLRSSIESVLAQTYPDFELVVINDGSSDGVERVLAEYRDHPKVRVLSQKNQRLPKALSNGFTFARGEFWTWTSADNLMEPLQLERQVAFLRANPDAQMVYCDYIAIDDRGEPLRDPNFRPHNRRSPESCEIHIPRDAALLNVEQDNFIGACFMYRGWAGRILGDYAPNLGVEDYDYWMRMNTLFSIRHLGTDEVLYRYRVHDNTLSAHAAEHRILERVQRLMRHDQERRAFFAKPFQIYADRPTREWLAGLDLGSHTVDEWPAHAPADGAKSVVLVHANSLPELARAERPAGAAVIAWFGDDPATPYRAASHIQHFVDGCFAADARTLARLELHTRAAWQVAPGAALLRAALARASDALFNRATIPPAEAVRELPQTLRREGPPLRVLLQADHFAQGGLEHVMLDLADLLIETGSQVTLLSLGREGPAVALARSRGLDYRHLGEEQRAADYRRLLTSEKFDVVSAHYSLFGADIAAELRIPFVQTVHNTYVWLSDEDRAQHRAADPFTAAYCCVSSAAALYADTRLGLSVDKMLVVPNGIDVDAMKAVCERADRSAIRRELGLDERDFVFLNVGSIYPPKSHHLLLAALRTARERNKRIKVAFLGRAMDEPYAERVRRQAGALGVADAVLWLGYQTDPQRYYHACDAFALPSFIEGWSLALTEALVAGLPIVATDVGGARDALGAPHHFLIPAPFQSITDVDVHNWYDLLEREHPAFVQTLADALVAAADTKRTPPTAEQLRRLDRRCAYQGYLRVFEWLVSGGTAAAARPWVWALHA